MCVGKENIMKSNKLLRSLLLSYTACTVLFLSNSTYEPEYVFKLSNLLSSNCSQVLSEMSKKAEETFPEYYCVDIGYYETGNSNYKPYEDYRAITNTNSTAYKFLHSDGVSVNSEGFLMLDNEYYCVALGHYFGNVGDKFLITLDNGFEFKAVIGDMKSKLHTDKNNYAHTNGHIIEFIIDSTHPYMEEINIRYHGLFNRADERFNGNITNIQKIIEVSR